MSQKNKKDDGLDTETTFADMNVLRGTTLRQRIKKTKKKREKSAVKNPGRWSEVCFRLYCFRWVYLSRRWE